MATVFRAVDAALFEALAPVGLLVVVTTTLGRNVDALIGTAAIGAVALLAVEALAFFSFFFFLLAASFIFMIASTISVTLRWFGNMSRSWFVSSSSVQLNCEKSPFVL